MKRLRIMKSLFAAAAIAIACTFVSARPVEAKSKKVYRPDTMKESYHFGDGHWITSSITNLRTIKKVLKSPARTPYVIRKYMKTMKQSLLRIVLIQSTIKKAWLPAQKHMRVISSPIPLTIHIKEKN